MIASTRLRVLVADDHPAVVRAVSRSLAREHDVVGTVADGGGLLEAVAHLHPDVVVLDLSLPHVDSFTACRQITQRNPEIRVVVFTAAAAPEIRRRAFAAGASAFVDKLASVDHLLSAVQGTHDGREATPL